MSSGWRNRGKGQNKVIRGVQRLAALECCAALAPRTQGCKNGLPTYQTQGGSAALPVQPPAAPHSAHVREWQGSAVGGKRHSAAPPSPRAAPCRRRRGCGPGGTSSPSSGMPGARVGAGWGGAGRVRVGAALGNGSAHRAVVAAAAPPVAHLLHLSLRRRRRHAQQVVKLGVRHGKDQEGRGGEREEEEEEKRV